MTTLRSFRSQTALLLVVPTLAMPLLTATTAASAAPVAAVKPAASVSPQSNDPGSTPTTDDLLARRAFVSERDAGRAATAYLARQTGLDGGQMSAIGSADLGAKQDQLTVTRVQQRVAGIPVLGGEYAVRSVQGAADGAVGRQVQGAAGQFYRVSVDPTSGPDRENAIAKTLAAVKRLPWREQPQITDQGLVIVPIGSGVVTRHLTVAGFDDERGVPVRRELYLAQNRTEPVLQYSSIETFRQAAAAPGPVDAVGVSTFHGPNLPLKATQRADGQVELRDQSRSMFAKTGGEILTYDADGLDVMQMAEDIQRTKLVEGNSTSFPAAANTSGALDAHWGAGVVYDYYFNRFGRLGLDGQGGDVVSVVGATAQGDPLPNAFWQGEYMVYGSGGDGYKPFSAGLDVVGHEMTHGVVDHTARLINFGQSGAINEGVSDYFGNAIQNDTEQIPAGDVRAPLLGEDLCLTSTPTKCATRDLADGRTVADFDGSGDDDGGVHNNATIIAGALWEARSLFGGEKFDPVVYRAVTAYLTPTARFLALRKAVLASARDLGWQAGDIAKVRAAFDKRGIKPGWQRQPGQRDSYLLRSDLGYGLGRPSAAAGFWVMSDVGTGAQSDRLRLYGGKVPTIQKPGAQQNHTVNRGRPLLPPSKLDYDKPVTDGRWIAATAEGKRTASIQLFRRGSTKVRTLAKLKDGIIFDVDVWRGEVAWVGSFGMHGYQVAAADRQGRVHKVPLVRSGKDAMVTEVEIRDGQVFYVIDPGFGDKNLFATQIVSYDLRTHRSRVLASFAPLPKRGVSLDDLVATDKYLIFSKDAKRDSLLSSISRIPLRGGPVVDLIPETKERGLSMPDLSANNQFVVYAESLFGPASRADKLFQMPIETTAGQRRSGVRVTCSRGSQAVGTAAQGKAVVYVDLGLGNADLVVRNRPAGPC